MSCNPALPTCYGICQVLIDQYYLFCDDVCLPEGYYFDPSMLPHSAVSIIDLKLFIRV